MDEYIAALNESFAKYVHGGINRVINEYIYPYHIDSEKKAELCDTPLKISVVYYSCKPNPNGLGAQGVIINLLGTNALYMLFILPYTKQPNWNCQEALNTSQENVLQNKSEATVHWTMDAAYAIESVFLRAGLPATASVKHNVFVSVWTVLENDLQIGNSCMTYNTKTGVIATVYLDYSADKDEDENGQRKITLNRTISSAFDPVIILDWQDIDSSQIENLSTRIVTPHSTLTITHI
jgi:hypothetical protein